MPLLRGQEAVRARAALADLSASYLRLQLSDLPDASLAGGLSGIALVHAVLDRAFPRAGHRARAEQALDGALARLTQEPLGPGLHSGVAGVGWVVGHCVGSVDEDGDDACAAFDAALGSVLDRSPWSGPFDLIEGLVGLGVYALERMPRRSGKRLLARIVDYLEEAAHRRRPGIAWRSDPRWLPKKLPVNTDSVWDLGVAHGVPGVIALLGHVVAVDVDSATRKKARTLLDGGVAWLFAQELPASAEACFPDMVALGRTRNPARLAWCYGDPGIAATLLLAARAASEPTWERAAVRIALRAAARPEASAGVQDAGLCHGGAGVAHIFHRLYRATGERRFAVASRSWFARTLAMRTQGRGFAGFRARDRDAQGRLRWRADPGFLMGAAGVALALVAATTNADPAWDRVLLLS